MDRYGRLKKGKRETRDEIVMLSRKFGRSIKRTKRWARRSIKKHAPLDLEKDFAQFCSVKDKGNKYHLSGCGPNSSGQDKNVLCPTCRMVVWHKHCLIDILRIRGLPAPDFNAKKWMCVHCILRSRRRQVV